MGVILLPLYPHFIPSPSRNLASVRPPMSSRTRGPIPSPTPTPVFSAHSLPSPHPLSSRMRGPIPSRTPTPVFSAHSLPSPLRCPRGCGDPSPPTHPPPSCHLPVAQTRPPLLTSPHEQLRRVLADAGTHIPPRLNPPFVSPPFLKRIPRLKPIISGTN